MQYTTSLEESKDPARNPGNSYSPRSSGCAGKSRRPYRNKGRKASANVVDQRLIQTVEKHQGHHGHRTSLGDLARIFEGNLHNGNPT